MNRIERAKQFAALAHGDQKRKYHGAPYVVHTQAVAATVTGILDEDAVIAAHLHDVVEDTAVTLDQIADEFGDRVARLVGYLTDPKNSEGNRAFRKAKTRTRYLMIQGQDSIDAHTIKAADCLDNAKDIAVNDPNFWKVCKQEMIQLLGVLIQADEGIKSQLAAVLGVDYTEYKRK